jgi:2-polyprenyl-3-methyl-5-hydroxy-6-metoxy-1,4-benzoquinol methylase
MSRHTADSEARKKREIDFHARVIAPKAETSRISPKVIDRYRVNRHWRTIPKEYAIKAMGNLEGKTVCDIGCGDGTTTIQLALLGAKKVVGVDLSPELIQVAKERLEVCGVPQGNVDFIVSDVEGCELQKELFDIVFVFSVLHHMDIAKAMASITGILKPGGTAVILEPVSMSARLQSFRRFFPVALEVTPDERQLSGREVELIEKSFSTSHKRFFRFIGRLERFLPNRHKIDKGHFATRCTLFFLYWLDQKLIRIFPGMSKYFGYVVIVGNK